MKDWKNMVEDYGVTDTYLTERARGRKILQLTNWSESVIL
jgi:hypothetical protein